MAQILVRDIEDDVKERLRRRAKKHGHSVEAEVRDILREAVNAETRDRKGLGTRIAARFKDIGLREGEELPELRGHTLRSPFEE